MVRELNERQLIIISILENSLRPIPMRELAKTVADLYFEGRVQKMSSIERKLRRDIDAIKFSDNDKVVVASNKGYFIGSKLEMEKRTISNILKHKKGLAKEYKQLKKLGNDYSLRFNEEGEIELVQATKGA